MGALTPRQLILGTVEDMAVDFLGYDRRGDDELRPGMIEEAIETGAITADEIVGTFKKSLEELLKGKTGS